jgi:hypothetical protein
VFAWVGRLLAGYLAKPIGRPGGSRTDARLVEETLRPGDVLLVEGNTRMAAAIRYLTQSTWSHAALYLGPRDELPRHHGQVTSLIEADVRFGVRAVPLSMYTGFRVRICRPVNLTPEDAEAVARYVLARLGHQYDLKNVFDLARYLLPLPVPSRWRRRLISFGSGDPTRAICSTLIAQAFGAVRYPILPIITRKKDGNPGRADQVRELWIIRHHSLYAPRDFDISPFFEIVKPHLMRAFDYRHVPWSEAAAGGAHMAAGLGDLSPETVMADTAMANTVMPEPALSDSMLAAPPSAAAP